MLSGVRTAVGATAFTRTFPSHSLARLIVSAATPAFAAAYAAIGASGRKKASDEKLTIAPFEVVSAPAAARLIRKAVLMLMFISRSNPFMSSWSAGPLVVMPAATLMREWRRPILLDVTWATGSA